MIVEIVLDVGPAMAGGAFGQRVYVQGAFTAGAHHPPLNPGRVRNVVSVFLDQDMRDLHAFHIETTWPEPGEPAVDVRAGDDVRVVQEVDPDGPWQAGS